MGLISILSNVSMPIAVFPYCERLYCSLTVTLARHAFASFLKKGPTSSFEFSLSTGSAEGHVTVGARDQVQKG